jgi:hypothetical protein
MDAAVIPFPIEETTPPVTKTYFGTGSLFYRGSRPPNRDFLEGRNVCSIEGMTL